MQGLALITGAASGFGYEFAKLLAQDSFDLLLVDIDSAGLQKVKKELGQKYNSDIELFACDLSEPQSALAVYSKARLYQVEVLINNAGFGLYGPFSATDWQQEEKMIYLHVFTITRLTKLILRDMIARKKGRIMNVSSLAAFQPGPLMSVYYATKAFILSFTEAIANEVKGTGVTVTAFCPGLTGTNFQKTSALVSNTRLINPKMRLAGSEKVARCGYKAMNSGKSICIPGLLNNFIVQLHRILPRKTIISSVRKIQEKSRR